MLPKLSKDSGISLYLDFLHKFSPDFRKEQGTIIMSLHLFGAQISNTFWRSKIEDVLDDLCLESGSKDIFTLCLSAVSFFCYAVSKLSKDFASGLCLHRSKTLRLRVQNVYSKEPWCCLLPLVSIFTTQQPRTLRYRLV